MRRDAMTRGRLCLLLAGAMITGRVERAAAQVGGVSIARVLTLSALRPGTLTVGVMSGMVQNLSNPRDNTVTSFPSPVVIVTQWNVNPGQTNTVDLMAYFSVPSAALSGGTTQIPSSRILARMTTGIPTAFTPISGAPVGGIGTAGGSLRLFSQTVTGANKSSSRTDNLELQLNLVGFPNLPTGTYSGTLNIRAVTQ